MINVQKLQAKLVELGVSVEELCRQIKMAPSTFYRKLKAVGDRFTIGEFHAICDALNLSGDEAISIFLPWISQ